MGESFLKKKLARCARVAYNNKYYLRKVNCIDKGGNAIIGIDFDYITFSNNMIGVVANGTAVRIEKLGI